MLYTALSANFYSKYAIKHIGIKHNIKLDTRAYNTIYIIVILRKYKKRLILPNFVNMFISALGYNKGCKQKVQLQLSKYIEKGLLIYNDELKEYRTTLLFTTLINDLETYIRNTRNRDYLVIKRAGL